MVQADADLKAAREADTIRAAEAAAALRAEEDAAALKAALEGAAKKAVEEAAARKAQAEEEAAKRRAGEEAAAKKRAEELAAKLRVEEEAAAMQRAEDVAAKKRADEEAARLARAEATKRRVTFTSAAGLSLGAAGWAAGEIETFEAVGVDGKVAFKSASGKYLSQAPDGTVAATSASPDSSALFSVAKAGAGFSIRALNGKYLSQPSSQGVAEAKSASVSASEIIQLENFDADLARTPGTGAFKAAYGKYLSP